MACLGAWAPPYHLLNALLHGGSGILLWRVLLRLRIPGAWLAALLFVIHPANAESVAWIAERKNTLSMFFMLASLLTYLRARDDKRMGLYAASILLFLFALFAKTAVVMLPFVLLILAWYQSGRITIADVLYSIPFFAMSLMLGIVTMIFQKENAIGQHVVRDDHFASRLATAGCAVWFYLFKLLLPINIIFNYPRWDIRAWGVAGFLPLAALAVVFGTLFYLRNTPWRGALAAMAIYVVMLLPILGFIDIFYMRYSLVSDHWQYQASPAILACVAAGAMGLYRKVGGIGAAGGVWATRRHIAAGAASIIGAALLTYTFYIAWIYRTPQTIWENTLAHNPQSWMAHVELGHESVTQQHYGDAILHFTQATRIVPDILDNWENLGNALISDGQTAEGLKLLEELREKNPERATIYNSLGRAYVAVKQPEKAIACFQEAIHRNPALVDAHFNLGQQLMKKDQFEQAREEFDSALKLQPDFAEAAFYLGGCLASERRFAESIPYFELAIQLKPDWPIAQAALDSVRSAGRGR